MCFLCERSCESNLYPKTVQEYADAELRISEQQALIEALEESLQVTINSNSYLNCVIYNRYQQYSYAHVHPLLWFLYMIKGFRKDLDNASGSAGALRETLKAKDGEVSEYKAVIQGM